MPAGSRPGQLRRLSGMTSSNSSMLLFVLGATGGTGRALVEQARQRGHRVTAFVRSPQKLGSFRDGVTVLQGDPRNADELRDALRGHDAVVSALGPPGLGPTTLVGDCARSTVTAMQATGVRRLLVVGVAVLFEDDGILNAIARRTFLRNVARDSAEMERIVRASGLDWTIARPPRLTNGMLTRAYGVADGRMPPAARLTISRADVADFLLDKVERPAHRAGFGEGSCEESVVTADEAVQPGNTRRDKIVYWISTGIVCAVMVFSIINFIFNDHFPFPNGSEGAFAHLGLPRYFKIELTVAKILGVLALSIPNLPRKIKEFAYFGFAITLVSASIAHFSRGDARLSVLFVIDPLIFLVILIVSYSYFQKTDTRIGSVPRARAS